MPASNWRVSLRRWKAGGAPKRRHKVFASRSVFGVGLATRAEASTLFRGVKNFLRIPEKDAARDKYCDDVRDVRNHVQEDPVREPEQPSAGLELDLMDEDLAGDFVGP